MRKLLYLLPLLFLSCAVISGRRDFDNDSIRDAHDHCPRKAEDHDGFQDIDGCPDYDNDYDGIPDSLDLCLNDKEDIDDFADKDGCPDIDNDADGLLDSADNCPNVAEDIDQWEDHDGCPEQNDDHDGDSIIDTYDHCPEQKEDHDMYEDADGCPDPDNDADGIPDHIDKCPMYAEVFNAFEDEDGCPDNTKPHYRPPGPWARYKIRGVNFESGATKITYKTQIMLKESIVKALEEWPNAIIVITGHTDNREKSPKKLSWMRAEAVQMFLLNCGIKKERVIIRGEGSTMPMASNKTTAGRAANRRIEINRIE